MTLIGKVSLEICRICYVVWELQFDGRIEDEHECMQNSFWRPSLENVQLEVRGGDGFYIFRLFGSVMEGTD
jgi:hypothetical protein